MKYKSIPFILTCFWITIPKASEVDSFNYRNKPLANSILVINNKTDSLLQDSLNNANADSSCDEKDLYSALRENFRNHILGHLTPFIKESPLIERTITPVEKSYIQNFGFFAAPITGGYARIFRDPSGHLININGIHVGTDKFEHMLGTGFKYFKDYYLKQKSITKILTKGWNYEKGIMGGSTTGVMSYADMSANLNGMRWWNNILLKNDDILGAKYNVGPYVICHQRKWVRKKPIDWSDYIDISFDEGSNCNQYGNKKLLAQVNEQISIFEKRDGTDLQCPIMQDEIEKIKEKYGEFLSAWIINSKQSGIIDDVSRPELKW